MGIPKSKALIVGSMIAAIAIALVLTVLFFWSQSSALRVRVSPADGNYAIYDLEKLCEGNIFNCESRLKGKVIVVGGVVDSFERASDGTPYVEIHGNTGRGFYLSTSAIASLVSADEISQLKAPSWIYVKGIVKEVKKEGNNPKVMLIHCIVLTKEEAGKYPSLK